jgi:hypothetical protein
VIQCRIRNIELNYCVPVFAFCIVSHFICCNNNHSCILISHGTFSIRDIYGKLFFRIRIKNHFLDLDCIDTMGMFCHGTSSHL